MTLDYDKALYYTLWGSWDDLLLIMDRTEDDLLSRKIGQFLNEYNASINKAKINAFHDDLLHYLDHAMQLTPITSTQI